MKARFAGIVAALASCVLATGGAMAGRAQKAEHKPDAQAAELFEAKVRPILIASCYGCHGEQKQMGSLRLDSLAAMVKGGGGGAVVVPGDAERSRLVKAIRYDGALKMPPSGKLKPEEIEAITAWVKLGAHWPGAQVTPEAVKAAQTGEYVISDSQRKHWAFQPFRKPPVPVVRDAQFAIRNPIDAFVLARLQAQGLPPNPPADRRTLIRRAYFDLTGLPPTADEIDAFVADRSPNAWEQVIDRLLASPRYGERWGRIWLDVARYADTRGYVFTEDRVYHNAYTYRDYVIRAFNEDLPYNEFILQQLAADRLPLGDDRRPLAALGFLTVGRRFLNNLPDIIDDRIDVTCRGLMGLTAGCARCHDHKFDPIPTRDYYSLYGVFASSTEPNPPPGISPKEITSPYEAQNSKLKAAEDETQNIIKTQVAELRKRAEATPDGLPDGVKKTLQQFRVRTAPNDQQLAALLPAFDAGQRDRLAELKKQAAELRRTMPRAPEFAMAVADAPVPVTPHVLKRGNPNNPGEEVPRRFLQILSPADRKPFTDGSGRLELARSIASADNPLTARVIVNRVWLNHFGLGLMRTPGDFGTRGEPPTHPELLDWLASELTGDLHWSLKKLHKLIMMSSTYKQSSGCDPHRFAADPENRLISRMGRRRLDLESLRDSLLAASGGLDLTVGGPSVDILAQPFSRRRTVYAFVERQNLPGLFRTFDFASPDASSPQRYRTTVPQQALYMMNSPFVVEQARKLAARPEMAACTDDSARIRALYRLALGRDPSAEETALGLRYVTGTIASTGGPILAGTTNGGQSGTGRTRWQEYAQVLLMSNEFAFVD